MKRILFRPLSLSLVLALLIQLLPGAVFAQNESMTEEDNAALISSEELTEEEILALGSSEPEPPAQILFEEEALREADVKHYRMSDGTYHAVQFEDPVHYQDEDGIWQEINNLLTPVTTFAGDTVYSVTNAEESRSFAGTLTEEAFFSLTDEEHSLSLALADLPADHVVMGDHASPLDREVSEPCTAEISAVSPAIPADSLEPDYLPEGYASCVTYPDAYPGVDLKYELFGYHVKESIIVKALREDYVFDFSMELDGLTAAMQTDGTIELRDEAGTLLYYIPAPYMVDAAGNYSEEVTHELLSRPTGGLLLRVEADGEWIESAQLPVTIDPTIFKIVNSESSSDRKVISNYIFSGLPNSNYANGQELYAGYTALHNGGEYQIISHINELPTIPQGSTVNAVQLNYNQSSFSNDSTQNYLLLQAHELTIAKPASFTTYEDWIDSLTWNSVYGNGSEIYDPTVLDFVKVTSSGSGSPITVDLTKIAREWYDVQWKGWTANKTLLFKTDCNANKRIVTTLSMYNYNNSNYLVVAYRNDVGIEDYYTYQTQGIGRAGTGYLSDHTQRLTLVNTLISSPSDVMPFGLSLIYNSSYGARNFNTADDIHSANYSAMHLGAGWKLSAQECVQSVKLSGDDAQTSYLVYTDADGTEHFFYRNNSTLWEDEDGLGLQLQKNSEGSYTNYTMTDKKDNQKYFRNGLLTYIKDAYGNAIYFVYNTSTFSVSDVNTRTWMPKNNGSDKLMGIYRINVGNTTPERLAAFTYRDDGYITGICDEAGRSTLLNYTSGGSVSSLTGLTYPDGKTVTYDYTSGRLTDAYDTEANYGMEYSYSDLGTIDQFREYTVSGSTNEGSTVLYGSSFSSWTSYANRSSYRYWGKDNQNDSTLPDYGSKDDLRTELIFDNYGRTVCSYSTNSDCTKILGSSALSYTENSGISKQNNRITAAGSAGMTAVNLLPDSGFENGIGDWADASSGTGCAAAVSIVTGYRRLHGAGGINLYVPAGAPSGAYAAIHTDVSLEGETEYTLSGWFSVSEHLTWDEDSKLEILWLNGSGSVLQRKTVVLDAPDSAIQNGWQRVSGSYTPPTTGSYRVQFRLSGCSGTAYLDDLQLEAAETPSTCNLVQDGSFEQANGTWYLIGDPTLNNSSQAVFGGKVLTATGNMTGIIRASQVIEMDCPASTTFLLSGWAKANCAPNPEREYGDNNRYFGLLLTIRYTDGTYEFHSLPFSWSNENWQCASLAIAPKEETKTLDYVQVHCAYNNNSGTALFDNISLRQEPVQTYTYDDEGNVESAAQTDTEESNYTYEGADLLSYTSSNNVKYNYTYNTQHDVLTATSDGVTATYTYSSAGNMTSSTLTGGSLVMASSATVTDSKNHTESTLDANGGTTRYNYIENRELLSSTTNPNGQTSNNSYDANNDRVISSYQTGIAAVTYTYADGRLSVLNRKTFRNGAEQHQLYNFAYNLWGQSTSVKVENLTLASYEYADIAGTPTGTGGGLLSKMTYGNGDSVSYTYDEFDRLVETVYNDTGNKIRYVYTADGALGELRYMDGDGDLISSYTFEYDSLGRLIRSTELDSAGQPVQRTEHLYDKHNRLSSQSWNIQGDSFSESYVYNDPDPAVTNSPGDGSLLRMTTATGATVDYGYDALKRLTGTTVKLQGASTALYTTALAYKNRDSGRTTNLVEFRNVRGPDDSLIDGYKYSYDALGNITEIAKSAYPHYPLVKYTYDNQNQLIQEKLYDGKGIADKNINGIYNYTYDTAGNLLTKTYYERLTDTDPTITNYTYGNAQWLDLLTAYNGGKIAYEGQTYSSSTDSVSGAPVSGNPISYYNGTRYDMQWEQGRNLKRSYFETENHTATSQLLWRETENTGNYTYDADGIRTGKTTVVKNYRYRASSSGGGGSVVASVGEDAADPNATSYVRYLYSTVTTAHSYITQNGKVVRETIGSGTTAKVLDFIYDESGKPFALTYTNGTAAPVTHYYVLNLQGDVVGLIDEDSALVAKYTYSAWGEILSVTDADGTAITSSTHIANLNPLRYRGYYYDTETGFYYLQSRYYDPVTHRFINADSYASTDVTDAISCNMFAYCGNNPVVRVDPTGEAWWHWAVATVAVAALVVASIVTCGGAAAAAATAAAIVAGTCTTVSATATIITGAAVGAGVAYAGAVINAASSSGSPEEFADYGESALVGTVVGGGVGAAAGYVNTRTACFVAGTLVLTEDGGMEIEKICADDYVWAWDEETGDVALKRVVETYVNETTELIHVFVNGEEIIATPTHPFYCPVKGWTDAAQLRAGDILVLVNGEYVVVEKVQHELLESPVKVYNFQVEDYHTYFVSDIAILVHNSCFNPKDNASRAARLSNGSTAYLQDSGQYSGQYIAKDFAGHGYNLQSAYKLFESAGGKYLRLVGDLSADGSFMVGKHSSNAGKLYEVIKWITMK